MRNQDPTRRWQQFPHRRVGRNQLLRTMRASFSETDPRYITYKRDLDGRYTDRAAH